MRPQSRLTRSSDADRGVVQRRASPRGQQLHCVLARLSILLALGDDEHRVVEADERRRIVRPQLRQELLDRGLHLRQRMLHAAADVDREDQIERRVLAHHAGDRLLHAILVDLEVLLLQAAHELAALGHDDRHQHGIGADLLGVAEILGADVLDEPASVGQRRDHADVMAANHPAGIPARSRTARAPPCTRSRPSTKNVTVAPSIGRIDPRLEPRRAADDRVRGRRGDLKRRLLARSAAPTTGRRPSATQDQIGFHRRRPPSSTASPDPRDRHERTVRGEQREVLLDAIDAQRLRRIRRAPR